MKFTTRLPDKPGLYRHRWDFRGQMKEQTLFVGYTNARAPLLQGTEPNAHMPRKLKCCKPDEHLHADRLTPEEWGGWWAALPSNPRADRTRHLVPGTVEPVVGRIASRINLAIYTDRQPSCREELNEKIT